MKKIINFLIIILIVTFNFNIKVNSMEKKLYDIEIESINGEIISLSKYTVSYTHLTLPTKA